MLAVKKRTIAIIVILSLIVGGAGAALVMGFALGGGNVVLVNGKAFAAMEETQQKYGKIDQLLDTIEAYYYQEVDVEQLLLGAYRGLLSGLSDQYSNYMTAEELESLIVSTSSEFQGIGITFSSNAQNQLVIIEVMEDSPALGAGLLEEDIILAVDDVPYTGNQLDLVGASIRGLAGTMVTLTIQRGEEVEDYTITRAHIVKRSAVQSEMLEDDIAYISITAFEDNTGNDFERALRGFETQQVKGLVIDLRNNPGGVVDAGVQVADLLLPACTIVYLVDGNGNRTVSNSDPQATEIPYVLLINGESASTAEIVAAAIKDNAGGPLVGTQTFGKGVVQSIIPLRDEAGAAIRLTTSQYLSPNGDVIHEEGVEPDYIVEPLEDGERDVQLEKALTLLQ